MHPDDTDYTQIARYLAGELSADERRAFERRLGSDQRLNEEAAELRRLWERAARQPSGGRVDAMWNKLSRRMHGAQPAPLRVTPVVPLRPVAPEPRAPIAIVWRAAIGIAATLVLAAGITIALRAGARDRSVAPAPGREYVTARGQRTTFRLDDGSTVELGYASTLRVVKFTNRVRELRLTGEAVFEVTHDSTRPFLVHAANATTEDLGTRFSVRAYEGDSAVRVVVVSGLVALRPLAASPAAQSGAPPAVIRPGQRGELRGDGNVSIAAADTSAAMSWLTDRLVVTDRPLGEIAADLERRFDVPIRFADPTTASLRVTANIDARSLDQLLDAVTVPLRLKHRRVDDAVLLVR
jgi:transmembrane sensor